MDELRTDSGKLPEKTVVIFGVSGFIGSNLAEFFSSDYKVVGTYHKNKVSFPNILTLPCNVINKEEVLLILFTFKPDIAIYCVGVSSLIECSKEEEMANALNTVGLFNVTEGCQRYQIQICYISSNYVFAGEKKEYMEMDTPDSNTIYGKTQSTVEFYIQKTGLSYILFRVCRMYGRGVNPLKYNWFEYLQRSLKKNIGVVCDNYMHVGFLDIYYLAMILKICFGRGIINRLFQVSSQDIATHLDFARIYCEIFNENDSMIQKGRWSFPFIDDTSIPDDENLYYRLGLSNVEGLLEIKMPSIRESLLFTKKRLRGADKEVIKDKGKEGVAFI